MDILVAIPMELLRRTSIRIAPSVLLQQSEVRTKGFQGSCVDLTCCIHMMLPDKANGAASIVAEGAVPL
jgi:hypothetical protein